MSEKERLCKMGRAWGAISVIVLSILCAVGITDAAGGSEVTLAELAGGGCLTEREVEGFFEYAEERARECAQVPDEFWVWVKGKERIYEGLLVTLHPDYNGKIISRLQELRDTYKDKVDDFPDLALAFAIVFGQAGEGTIRAPWMGWVAKGRDVPSMVKSFEYYVRNERRMIFPLRETAWPLLVHVADNDVPLGERNWVLSHYKGRDIKSLSRIHSDPKYITGKAARKVAQDQGSPMSLPRIYRQGGVCSQQGYFANRVFKSLGIPSIRLMERAHAYEGWVNSFEDYSVQYGGAVGRKNGGYFCPVRRDVMRQEEFRLEAASMKHSYEGFIRALVACHLFDAVADERKDKTISILKDGLDESMYCSGAWRRLADFYCRDAYKMAKADELMYDAKEVLSEYPTLLCDIICRIFKARLDDESEIDGVRYIRDVEFLKLLNEHFEDAKRLDLAARVRIILATYVKRDEGLAAAVELYSGWLESTDVYEWYQQQLAQLMKLAKGEENNDSLRALLEREHKRLPVYEKSAIGNMIICRRRKVIVNNLEATLRKTGLKKELGKMYLSEDVAREGARWSFGINSKGKEVLAKGKRLSLNTFGAIGQEVEQTQVIKKGEALCYVWRVLPDYLTALRYRVFVKHAEAGKEGGFYITAWSDTDGDGLPDDEIGRSELKESKLKDDWSSWEFETEGKNIFVGMVCESGSRYYYQMRGVLGEYFGLGDRVFYARRKGQIPKRSVSPRYANIRIEPLE
jgi:hypothetical protein